MPTYQTYTPPPPPRPPSDLYENSEVPGVAGAGGAAAPGTLPFNINPGPQGGQGPYGAVPGPIGLPNPLGDIGRVYPNLTGTNAQLSQDILGQLRGELSPETVSNIEDEAARFGVSSGMPGSGLSHNRMLKNLGLTTLDTQNRGIANYLSALPTVGRTLTVDPALQVDIANRNATMGAAPDPGAAAAEARSLWDQYFSKLGGRSAGGGRGGGVSVGSIGMPNLYSPSAPSSPGYGPNVPASGSRVDTPYYTGGYNPPGSNDFYPNPSGDLLPLYPGGPTPGQDQFDFNNPPPPNYDAGTYANPIPYDPSIDSGSGYIGDPYDPFFDLYNIDNSSGDAENSGAYDMGGDYYG